jgi:hypothetical protein
MDIIKYRKKAVNDTEKRTGSQNRKKQGKRNSLPFS